MALTPKLWETEWANPSLVSLLNRPAGGHLTGMMLVWWDLGHFKPDLLAAARVASVRWWNGHPNTTR